MLPLIRYCHYIDDLGCQTSAFRSAIEMALAERITHEFLSVFSQAYHKSTKPVIRLLWWRCATCSLYDLAPYQVRCGPSQRNGRNDPQDGLYYPGRVPFQHPAG